MRGSIGSKHTHLNTLPPLLDRLQEARRNMERQQVTIKKDKRKNTQKPVMVLREYVPPRSSLVEVVTASPYIYSEFGEYSNPGGSPITASDSFRAGVGFSSFKESPVMAESPAPRKHGRWVRLSWRVRRDTGVAKSVPTPAARNAKDTNSTHPSHQTGLERMDAVVTSVNASLLTQGQKEHWERLSRCYVPILGWEEVTEPGDFSSQSRPVRFTDHHDCSNNKNKGNTNAKDVVRRTTKGVDDSFLLSSNPFRQARPGNPHSELETLEAKGSFTTSHAPFHAMRVRKSENENTEGFAPQKQQQQQEEDGIAGMVFPSPPGLGSGVFARPVSRETAASSPLSPLLCGSFEPGCVFSELHQPETTFGGRPRVLSDGGAKNQQTGSALDSCSWSNTQGGDLNLTETLIQKKCIISHARPRTSGGDRTDQTLCSMNHPTTCGGDEIGAAIQMDNHCIRRRFETSTARLSRSHVESSCHGR